MTLFQFIVCLKSPLCATVSFLPGMYCKQHAQCNIAARLRGFMHI